MVMKAKAFSVLASIPLVSVGILGFSGLASAVSFSQFDALQLGGRVQATPGNNILFNLNNPPGGAPVPLAPVNTFGKTLSGGGTGTGFSQFIGGEVGAIKSFNAATMTGGLTSPNYFIAFDGLNGSQLVGDGFVFSLNQPPVFNFTNAGIGQIDFFATGRARNLTTGETVDINYNFTAQGLGVPDPNGPFTPGTETAVGSYSGTLRVTVITVPEPSSLFGLLAIGSVAVAGIAKRQKSN